LQAVSLDSIADDQGRRLVENCRAVAWNGLGAAFDALARTYPPLAGPRSAPLRVTIMGAGAIGKHAVEAATKYGSVLRDDTYGRLGVPGVEVVTVGRNLSGDAAYMTERLRQTDVLVDATQRGDTSRPLVPNSWIGGMPEHAVICDLVVDPYLLEADPPTMRGIEGIPQGNLDRFVFDPGDPDWDATVPAQVRSDERRTVVSCYSWPGVHPDECMELYGIQLDPLLHTLVARGGIGGIRADGDFHERALHRASLRPWALDHSSRRAEHRTASHSASVLPTRAAHSARA
jgi:alanine dehydrogenase